MSQWPQSHLPQKRAQRPKSVLKAPGGTERCPSPNEGTQRPTGGHAGFSHSRRRVATCWRSAVRSSTASCRWRYSSTACWIRTDGVAQTAVEDAAVPGCDGGALRDDEALLLQLRHVLAHRVLAHAGGVPNAAVQELRPLVSPGRVSAEYCERPVAPVGRPGPSSSEPRSSPTIRCSRPTARSTRNALPGARRAASPTSSSTPGASWPGRSGRCPDLLLKPLDGRFMLREFLLQRGRFHCVADRQSLKLLRRDPLQHRLVHALCPEAVGTHTYT